MKILLFPLKLIFIYPGKIILWYRYFFPEKNKKKGGFISVAESRRQYKEGGNFIAFIISCGFWISTAVLFLSSIGGGGGAH